MGLYTIQSKIHIRFNFSQKCSATDWSVYRTADWFDLSSLPAKPSSPSDCALSGLRRNRSCGGCWTGRARATDVGTHGAPPGDSPGSGAERERGIERERERVAMGEHQLMGQRQRAGVKARSAWQSIPGEASTINSRLSSGRPLKIQSKAMLFPASPRWSSRLLFFLPWSLKRPWATANSSYCHPQTFDVLYTYVGVVSCIATSSNAECLPFIKPTKRHPFLHLYPDTE